MTHTRKLLVAAALVFALAACGQSGPLYLPGDPSEVQNLPDQLPDVPVQDEDDEEDENDQDEDGGT